jgi:hypothetical protein
MSKEPSERMSALYKDEIPPEYDLSGGVRGKYTARLAEGTNLVPLDPDVAKVFPDAQAVNDALRALAKIIEERTQDVA